MVATGEGNAGGGTTTGGVDCGETCGVATGGTTAGSGAGIVGCCSGAPKGEVGCIILLMIN